VWIFQKTKDTVHVSQRQAANNTRERKNFTRRLIRNFRTADKTLGSVKTRLCDSALTKKVRMGGQSFQIMDSQNTESIKVHHGHSHVSGTDTGAGSVCRLIHF
jgi:hypothetical protein